MIDLSGKRAFVTGGGRGIGRATALLLARAGARVALGYRSRKEDAAQTVAAVKRLGGQAVSIRGELGNPETATQTVAEAVAALGGLDLLIVNHGIWPPDDAPLAQMSVEQWVGTRTANLDAVFFVCRAAIPRLADGGRIVRRIREGIRRRRCADGRARRPRFAGLIVLVGVQVAIRLHKVLIDAGELRL